MPDQKNILLAVLLSMAVLAGFHYFVERPRMEEIRAAEAAAEAERQAIEDGTAIAGIPAGDTMPMDAASVTVSGESVAMGGNVVSVLGESFSDLDAALERDARVPVQTEAVRGSLRLRGGRIDDLILERYAVEQNGEERVRLLYPQEALGGYYVDYGWTASRGTMSRHSLPGANTLWSAPEGAVLTTETPVTLTYDNGTGLVFTRQVAIDENYMMTVTQSVANSTGEEVQLAPYGVITREGTPYTTGFFILHEGPIGVIADQVEELDYEDLEDMSGARIAENQRFSERTTGGWLGFTDKYWLVSLVPGNDREVTASFLDKTGDPDSDFRRYQADFMQDLITIPAEGSESVESMVFAGAKVTALLDHYEDEYDIKLFNRAIDWGIFFFLTRPFFWALHGFAMLFGSWGVMANFGLAILAFTVIVKLVFFPLQNKAFKSMTMMKKLQPEMVELRERFKADPPRMQQEVMALYKRENVNPLSGCLPIVVQIPVFFALYKVLFVTIEMRHAPFYGWIHDLSAPDPTSVVNLFGLMPWGAGPDFIAIGALPLLMGLTMWLQTKMNPAPPDPTQAIFMNILPVFFTFLLAGFPAGLVMYWVWNNMLSILQQYVIMRRMGVKVGGGADDEAKTEPAKDKKG